MSRTVPGGAAVGDRTASSTFGASSYPIDFVADYPTNPKKLYAVPIVGMVIRSVMMIPHMIVGYVLILAMMVVQLVAWIPVLFTGKYPQGLYNFNSGVLLWMARIYGYQFGLTDQYPPFSLSNDDTFSLRVDFQRPESSNRLYAIPVLGYFIKSIMLIPHVVALYVIGLIAGLMQLVAWIPVLASGRYPEWNYSFTTGYIRWAMRTGGFALGLTDQYPPFRMGS